MTTDNRTPNHHFPLPFKDNSLVTDVERISMSLTMIDTEIGNSSVSSVAGKTGDVILVASDVGAASIGHQHVLASPLDNGFMSSSDKAKLDGIIGTGNYTLPVATTFALGGVKDGYGVHIGVDGALAADVLTVAGKSGNVLLGIGDIIGLEAELSSKLAALGFTPEDASKKGAINGYAPLSNTGKIPTSYLPAFVDEVIEYANLASFPAVGTGSIIYVALDSNRTYRWSGTSYTQIVGGVVDSVNGQVGVVLLNAANVGAAATNHIHNVASNAVAGFMSTIDKAKLDSITGTGSYSLPIASPTVLGGVKGGGSGITVAADGRLSADVASVAGKTGAVTLVNTDVGAAAAVHSHSIATTTIAGYMSNTDKAKLDGIVGTGSYTLPVATTGALGGVKDGIGVVVAADGTLTADVISVAGKIGAVTLTATDVGAAAINHTHSPVDIGAAALGAVAGSPLAPISAPGSASTASRSDHVHPYPTPAQIGAPSVSTVNVWSETQYHTKAIIENCVTLPAGGGNIAIPILTASVFVKQISAATVFTINGPISGGNVACFLFELINGGSSTITWWANIKWPNGVPPILTVVGRDILSFYTQDNGTTWRGMMIAKDVK